MPRKARHAPACGCFLPDVRWATNRAMRQPPPLRRMPCAATAGSHTWLVDDHEVELAQDRPRVQLPGQAGDQHGVLVVGLVGGQVLGPAGPRRRRGLHAHERHRPVGRRAGPAPATGARSAHTPPSPQRTRPFAARPAAQSNAAPRSHALTRNVRRASTLESWSRDHDHLLAIGQVDPDDRVRHRHRLSAAGQPCVPVPITTRDTTTVRHERPPCRVGTPSPTSASGGRSQRQTRRRSTPSYAAVRSTTMPL